jgi:hypothetical protein
MDPGNECRDDKVTIDRKKTEGRENTLAKDGGKR